MQKQLVDSPSRYSTIAIALHWIVAALFLASYVSVYYRRWFTERGTPENLSALQLHLAIGVTIAAFVIARVLWRMSNPPPPPIAAPAWQLRTAHITHVALYAFMIVMPITGYLGSSAAPEYFGLPKFEDTALFQWLVVERMGLTFKEFEVPIDFIHKRSGAYVIWVLIALHAGAALYHHFILRDSVLVRMLPAADHTKPVA